MNNTPTIPVITSARITAMPRSLFDPMPEVIVIDSTGKETTLFQFYPDEISFTETEFIGLTLDDARRLKFTKDKAYLQS
jgi:hypothetical protein